MNPAELTPIAELLGLSPGSFAVLILLHVMLRRLTRQRFMDAAKRLCTGVIELSSVLVDCRIGVRNEFRRLREDDTHPLDKPA